MTSASTQPQALPLPSDPPRLRPAVLRMAAWYAILLIPAIAWLSRQGGAVPQAVGYAPNKLAYYVRHKGEFNMVFVGDSRTYCGIHPDLIDPILGSRSYNLAIFAHWFPTQYPSFQALAPAVPRDTTVVWSIGHKNFQDLGAVQEAYPIGWSNVPWYLRLGYSWKSLRGNLFAFGPMASVRQMLADIDAKRDRSLLGRRPPPLPERVAAPLPPILEPHARHRLPSRDIQRIEPVMDGDKLTSMTVFKWKGAYERVELDSAYFRQKQREVAPLDDEGQPPAADARMLALFEASLDLFQRHRVRLVVNELEEAPHRYTPAGKAMFRRFMREHIQPRVEARGFIYVRTNLDELSDADYFDYNHLNSQGIAKYATMLSEALRPHLGKP